MYRIIIADDERIECMVLERIIRSAFGSQLELLNSVQDGISLIQAVEEKRPDIAIVDINMPGLNGLDAIEILKMKNASIRILIHTAYSEFSYAQKALQLGASDYLVKPNLKEEIIDAVRKVCNSLDENARKNRALEQSSAHNLWTLSADKWMMSLFLEDDDSGTNAIVRNYCPDIQNGWIFTAWKICLDISLSPAEKEAEYTFLKEELSKFCTEISLLHQGVLYCLLLPGRTIQNNDWKNWLSDLADFFIRKKQKDGIRYLIGVSSWHVEEEFDKGIEECQMALFHRNQPGLYFFVEKSRRLPHVASASFTAGEAAKMILDGQSEQAAERILQLFNVQGTLPSIYGIEQNEKSSEQQDRGILSVSDSQEFLCSKINAALFIILTDEKLERLSEKEPIPDFSFWKSFRAINTWAELSEWIEKSVHTLSLPFLSMKAEHNPYVINTCRYIMKHYGEDFSLDDVADKMGISPFYLSRLIKSDSGTTFVEILTDTRICKAMVLLSQSRKPIKEIGCDTGYPNQSYFYKVFKKTTGISLGEIRKYL